MMKWIITTTSTTLLWAAAPNISGFVIIHSRERSRTTRSRFEFGLELGASSQSPLPNSNELFESDNWPSIQKELDTVPIFTCANQQGKPLAYSIELSDGKSYQVPFFYCDVEDAKKELAKAKNDIKIEGLDLIPVGLGQVFRMWATDKAVIVPNANAIRQAGAPPNTNPVGQQVPLFACMDIMQENEETGEACLPLFLVLEEANAAMEQAIEMDGKNSEDEFEVVALSLSKAVELLATVPEKTPAFRFMPPAASINHINNYLTS